MSISTLKKIAIITSISLNVVFIVLLIKWVYHYHMEDDDTYDKKLKPPPPIHGMLDDHDDDDDDHSRRLARKVARQIFSSSEIRDNFDRMRDIHYELMDIAEKEPFNGEEMREQFDHFSKIFIDNKKAVEEKLIRQMEQMTPEERHFLMKGFLRKQMFKK